jgi:L-rhamnose isomerase
MTLSEYIDSKNKFQGVALLRLVYKGISSDYSKWKLSGQNLFLYDNELKVSRVLWGPDQIKVIDDTKIVINYELVPGRLPVEEIGLELFYGGAIL